MGLHEIKKKDFNELEHETAHCMHEKLDLWYLSEFFLSLRYKCTQRVVRIGSKPMYHKLSRGTMRHFDECIDSDEPVQPPFKLTNSKRC